MEQGTDHNNVVSQTEAGKLVVETSGDEIDQTKQKDGRDEIQAVLVVGEASKKAVAQVNNIIRNKVEVQAGQMTAGSQHRSGVNKLQCLFIRAIMVAADNDDRNTLQLIASWCSQHNFRIPSFRYPGRKTVSFAQNERLDEWLDHIDKKEVRKPAPPFELWMPVAVAQCRILFSNGDRIPHIERVASKLCALYYMQALKYLQSTENTNDKNNYEVLKDLLKLPPSEVESAIRLPYDNQIRPAPSAVQYLSITDAKPEAKTVQVATDGLRGSAKMPPIFEDDDSPLQGTAKLPSRPKKSPGTGAPSIKTVYSTDSQDSDITDISTPPSNKRELEARYRLLAKTNQKLLRQCRTRGSQLKQLTKIILNQSETNKNQSETNKNQSATIRENATTVKEMYAEVKRLVSENDDLRRQLMDNIMAMDQLMKAGRDRTDEYFRNLDRLFPKDFLSKLVKTPEKRKELKDLVDVLTSEGFKYPRILEGDLTKMPEEGAAKLFELLKPASGLYDKRSGIFLFLTHGDNRDEVTADDIDNMCYEILPKVGFTVQFGITVKDTSSNEFVLGLISRSQDEIPDLYGSLAVVAARTPNAEHTTLESDSSEGTSTLPMTPRILQDFVYPDCRESTATKTTVTKFRLTSKHQQGLHTPFENDPVMLVLDSVDLDDGGKALLGPSDSKKPMMLTFFKKLDGDFPSLKGAIEEERVSFFGLNAIQLCNDDHQNVKELLVAARSSGCEYSLENITHKELTEDELIEHFADLVEPKSFQDLPPDIGADDYQDDYSPDVTFAKKEDTLDSDGMWKVQPNATKCNYCLAPNAIDAETCVSCQQSFCSSPQPDPPTPKANLFGGELNEFGFSFTGTGTVSASTHLASTGNAFTGSDSSVNAPGGWTFDPASSNPSESANAPEGWTFDPSKSAQEPTETTTGGGAVTDVTVKPSKSVDQPTATTTGGGAVTDSAVKPSKSITEPTATTTGGGTVTESAVKPSKSAEANGKAPGSSSAADMRFSINGMFPATGGPAPGATSESVKTDMFAFNDVVESPAATGNANETKGSGGSLKKVATTTETSDAAATTGASKKADLENESNGKAKSKTKKKPGQGRPPVARSRSAANEVVEDQNERRPPLTRSASGPRRSARLRNQEGRND